MSSRPRAGTMESIRPTARASAPSIMLTAFVMP
jgi:hypothetical protein